MKWTSLLILVICLAWPGSFFAAETSGSDESSLIELGRRIYQLGERENGSAVKAFVLGDVEVFGNQFTCLNCHRRSGLGGPEGTKFVLPTNGRSLLEPRIDMYMARPAYNLQTFTEAMGQGINPNGYPFDPIMPMYELSERENKALFSYLKTLSNEHSPGLTEEVLHVATVISENVNPRGREAMMSVLETFVGNKNAETRLEKKRSDSGPYYHEYRNKAYRRWIHHVWELSGPPETWKRQLADYYEKQPVFVLLSGMVQGEWTPVHEFSQEKRIPCLLPNTDLPDIEDKSNFYTVYFSRGFALEADVLATGLARQEKAATVVQVYRRGEAGESAAQIFANMAAEKFLKVESIALQDYDNIKEFRSYLASSSADSLVFWLDRDDLEQIAAQLEGQQLDSVIYFSASLAGEDADDIYVRISMEARVIHPFVLPQEQSGRFFMVQAWLKGHQVPMLDPRIQAQTYYACFLLKSGLAHIKRYFYREYLLDLIDHGDRLAQYSGNYPRLSFGPEQRFLAKGAYILDLTADEYEWIVPY